MLFFTPISFSGNLTWKSRDKQLNDKITGISLTSTPSIQHFLKQTSGLKTKDYVTMGFDWKACEKVITKGG